MQEKAHAALDQGGQAADQGDDTFLDGLTLLLENWKISVGVPFLAGVLAFMVAWVVPKVYEATTRMLPPQQSQNSLAAALSAQLGGLANLAGSALNIRNPADLYVGLLKSRTVADRLIAQFKLQELYEEEKLVDTRKALESKTSIAVGKDGIISITFEDKDPARAASIANAHVDALKDLLTQIAVTDAGERRAFFEKQLRKQKELLAEAEVALRKTQETTGLIKLDDQGRAIIDSIARLRAQAAAKEVQIGAMGIYATSRNPQFLMAQEELAGLRAQLGKLEGSEKQVQGDVLLAPGRVPGAGLEYIRKLRDVKYNETLFELLARQYEIARVEESRETLSIQVVDRAVPSDKKSKPKRLLWAIAGAILAFLASCFYLAFREWRRDPAAERKIQRLRLALRGAGAGSN